MFIYADAGVGVGQEETVIASGVGARRRLISRLDQRSPDVVLQHKGCCITTQGRVNRDVLLVGVGCWFLISPKDVAYPDQTKDGLLKSCGN